MSAVLDSVEEAEKLAAEKKALEAQANAELEAQAVRRLGHLEAVKKQFSLVSGEGRTENAIALGQSISNACNEERSIEKKKKLLEEFAKQVCGNYSDDKKLKPFVVLHHASLRIPTLKTLGLSWSLKVVGAMGAQLDWKSMTDTMTALQIERANVILPMLVEGIDGVGRKATNGNPDRAEWCKIIKYYLETGNLPAETTPADKTPATASPADATLTTEPVGLTVESISAWLNHAGDSALSELADKLDQSTMDRLFDALALATTRKQEAIKLAA